MITKNEALEILGLNERSMASDIETRYAMLVKRYRAEQNNEKLEEISLAYNIVKGIYVEPEPEDPRMKEIIFGKSRSQWRNTWLYGKYKFLGLALGAGLLIYFIITVITNKPADFKLAAVGEFFIPDTQIAENYVIDSFEEINTAQIATAFLSEDFPDQNAAYAQKAMILLTVSGEDVIIVDRDIFERYASMGAFVQLNDLFDEISGYENVEQLGILPAVSEYEDGSNDNESNDNESKDNESKDNESQEMIFGIDVSDSQLLSAIGINGRSQIITISIKSEKKELAADFIRKLFTDTPELIPQISVMPSPTPSPQPSPTPTITVAP